VKEKIIPADWGKDPLSEFIEVAQHNTLATFDNLKPEYTLLKAINDVFKNITENLLNVESIMPSFFLLRAHASYLGAVRLAISGQVPETYMVLRGCLENSLYALHISRVADAGEIWLRRHNDKGSLQKCKQHFLISNVFESLEAVDKVLSQIARRFYEITIDYGGHPNEASLTSIMRRSDDESKIRFIIPYLISYKINPDAFGLGLKSTARIGVCSLLIFRIIFRQRFDILGLSVDLEKLKQGL
jgi:hypothetical protein